MAGPGVAAAVAVAVAVKKHNVAVMLSLRAEASFGEVKKIIAVILQNKALALLV